MAGGSSSWNALLPIWQYVKGDRGPRGVPRVLNYITLQFKHKEMERFYMEHHWLNMRYWLWRSVAVGVLYLVASLIFGDEIIAKVFDVRMDHYSKTTLLTERPNWMKEQQAKAVNGTQEDADMFHSIRVIGVDEEHMIEIPRAGFLLWHATWCLLFLVILVVDRLSHRLRCVKTWNVVRAWVAFGVMFLDLVITSFLDPSVARFMTFVYAVLVRAQFMQTLCLVSISSVAMLSAGYVGSHDFLNSVSVAEFLIMNLVCLLASRQTEIHARLSLYRLWYIMTMDKERRQGNSPSRAFHGDVTEENLAQNLLSLAELKLSAIPEHSQLEQSMDSRILDVEAAFHIATGSDAPFPPPASGQESPPQNYPPSPGSSGRASIKSNGSRESSSRRTVGKATGRGRRSLSKSPRSSKGSRELSPLERKPTGEGGDSDSDRASEAGSFCSDAVMHKLPPWLALEGPDNFKQSETGAFSDECRWAEVADVERFHLRGKNYISDRAKIPANASAFAVHQARLFKTVNPLYHVAGKLPSLKAFLLSHPTHFFFIYNRIVPYKNGTIMNVVSLLVRRLPKGDDPAFDRVFDRFIAGDDDFRNRRLKHLSSLREAPSVVTNAIWLMGGEKPVILGKGYMDQRHFVGRNYVEVDIDVTPSRTARMVVGKVIDHAAKVIMEEMLVLEGQSAEELPERPLAAWRWIKVNPEATIIKLDESTLIDDSTQESL